MRQLKKQGSSRAYGGGTVVGTIANLSAGTYVIALQNQETDGGDNALWTKGCINLLSGTSESTDPPIAVKLESFFVEEQEFGNFVHWFSTSGVNVAGYYIWRGNSQCCDFERISPFILIQDGGEHSFFWDGLSDSEMMCSSGVYFIHLKTDNKLYIGKMIRVL